MAFEESTIGRTRLGKCLLEDCSYPLWDSRWTFRGRFIIYMYSIVSNKMPPLPLLASTLEMNFFSSYAHCFLKSISMLEACYYQICKGVSIFQLFLWKMQNLVCLSLNMEQIKNECLGSFQCISSTRGASIMPIANYKGSLHTCVIDGEMIN